MKNNNRTNKTGVVITAVILTLFSYHSWAEKINTEQVVVIQACSEFAPGSADIETHVFSIDYDLRFKAKNKCLDLGYTEWSWMTKSELYQSALIWACRDVKVLCK